MSKASDRAYQLIRDAITDGELEPGRQLTEEELAERCAVSRTPVRDALRRLENDLYIQRSESQRIFVTDWSLEDLAESYTLRAMLEGHAASRAASRASHETLERLRQINHDIADAIGRDPPDVDRFLELNRAYHVLILEAAAPPRLGSLLNRLILPPVVQRTAKRYDRGHFQRSLAEHEDIVAAIAARDAAWASTVMTAHIRRAYHVYSTYSDGSVEGSPNTESTAPD